jgi:hypothetical protein
MSPRTRLACACVYMYTYMHMCRPLRAGRRLGIEYHNETDEYNFYWARFCNGHRLGLEELLLKTVLCLDY